MKKKKILAADLFCGAGGTSQGLLLAANHINADLELVAVNHWQTAIDTHTLNHPEARNLCTGLAEVDPLKLVPGGRLHVLCASPECTHHSVARGGKPMDDQSRSSPMLILDWLNKLVIDTVIIENVPEFQGWGPLIGPPNHRRPDPRRKGELFNAWVGMIRALGYRVEWRVLNCADYGAPTTRKRLFLICRRNNRKITWPEPTHVPPAQVDSRSLFAETRKPWRTAREIIDWTRESRDIFDRKKPLSPNTLRRISAGMRKFNGIQIDLEKCVREGLRPYIVVLRGTGTVASVDDPLQTVTASGTHYGLVQPFLLPHRAKDGVHAIDDPLRTVTVTSSDFAIVEPFILGQQSGAEARSVNDPVPTVATAGAISLTMPMLVQTDQTGSNGICVRPVDQPVFTAVTSGNLGVAEPFLTTVGGATGQGRNPHGVDEPLGAVLTNDRRAVAEPFLVPNFGEREGQQPRTHGVDAPVPAVTGHGAGALVEPFVVPQFGTADPRSIERPLGTVTTTSRGVGLAEPFLTVTNHGEGLERRVRSVDQPMATVTRSMGDGVAQPCLVEYYGNGQAQSIDEPVPTVVTKDRFGLALPEWIKEGDLVYRLEIRFRMLQPRELARAQGFPDEYQFTGNREAVVKQIGNAVPPPMAQALALEVLSC